MPDWPRRQVPMDAPVAWRDFQKLIDLLGDVITTPAASSSATVTIAAAFNDAVGPTAVDLTGGDGVGTAPSRNDHWHAIDVSIAPSWTSSHQWTASNIYPTSNYTGQVGTLTNRWLQVHAAELVVQTLVAENVMATIGGRILVAPTVKLTRALAAAGTTIYVDGNEMANGDRVYMEKAGQVEFIAIASVATDLGGGEYSYTVTRNLDGTGANDWIAGDAVLNTGTTGDGFIDLYSVSGVNAGTTAGPTIVGNVRNSATYSDWSPTWAIGNLKNLYGMGSSDVYGAAFGKHANSSSFITVDATNGIRIQQRTAGADHVIGQWDVSGNLALGEVATNQGNAYWNNTNKRLEFRGGTNGTVVQAYVDTTGKLVAANGSIILDSSALSVGANPAQSGFIRLSNNQVITARNAANTADVTMIGVNASNEIELGSTLNMGAQEITNVDNIFVTGDVFLKTNASSWLMGRNAADSGYIEMFTLNASNQILAGINLNMGDQSILNCNGISFGTNPSATGRVNLPNASWITARNAANSADIDMWSVDANDRIVSGTGVAVHVEEKLYVGSTYADPGANNLAVQGNIILGDGSYIGQAAGPQVAFDDTNNYLEITGCNVGVGLTTPTKRLVVGESAGVAVARLLRYEGAGSIVDGTVVGELHFDATDSDTVESTVDAMGVIRVTARVAITSGNKQADMSFLVKAASGNYDQADLEVMRLHYTGQVAIERSLYVGSLTGTDPGDNNGYFEGDCSALTFTDRTPMPGTLEEAYAIVHSVKAQTNDMGEWEVNHNALHKAIKSGEGRNLSALVSAQNTVLQDLIARIKKLET